MLMESLINEKKNNEVKETAENALKFNPSLNQNLEFQ